MFSIASLSRNINLNMYLLLHARFKSKTHWAKLKKKTGSKYKALTHFDDFYGSVFGEQWQPIREALFRRPKYVALINNYGDAEETMEYLKNRGAHCFKTLISVQKDFHEQYSPKTELSSHKNMQQSEEKLREYVAKVHKDEISLIYSKTDEMPERLDLDDVTLHKGYEDKNVPTKEKITPKNLTLDESLAEAKIDESRIIDPSMGLTSEVLYQYLPATKLKGMDEWVPESLHYSFYSQDKDFPLVMEPETEFEYPEHLKVYTYEMDSDYNMFPEPKRSQTGVFNYYPLDCGSVLAVLALCLSPGDRVLDLCAAPGGKSLVALQTLLPEVIVCNDMSISRCNRMRHIFRDYLFDFETSNRWRERVLMSRVDGRMFADDQGFDKILVDVPCTTDRHSVTEDENNIFRPDRIKERLRIPEMQSQLLANALKSVRVGGAVVYSTCSLSPIQNDGAVHMALRYAFETHGVLAAVKDLTPAWAGLSSTVHLAAGQAAPRYGQLVLPSVGANFGPAYIARFVRIK